MLKKLLFSFLLIFCCLVCCGNSKTSVCYAEDIVENIISVYNENSELITCAQNVQVGDLFISSDNSLYYVYFVDEELKIAYAGKQTDVTLPEVRKTYKSSLTSATDKKIGMYHTHNAESYVIGDGTDSIYGKGGVMDIGVKFKSELEKKDISILRSENLHLPHDTSAYSRSAVTAKSLINANSLDAIFDVHRDGVARAQYLTTVNNIPCSKVRIVVGKANAGYQDNLDFALAIKAYADEYYPGLIKDIYMASGHYNQALHSRALLFEMGTYLIEKDYVINSLDELAVCVDKVLYTSSVVGPSGEDSFAEESGVSNNLSEEETENGTLKVGESASAKTNNFDVVGVIMVVAMLGLSATLIGIMIKKSIMQFKQMK